MKTIKNNNKNTFIINKHFVKSHSVPNKLTKFNNNKTKKNLVLKKKITYEMIKDLIDNNSPDLFVKIKIFIKDILILNNISEKDIFYFLKLTKIKTPIKFASKSVPDLLALPMKISNESRKEEKTVLKKLPTLKSSFGNGGNHKGYATVRM